MSSAPGPLILCLGNPDRGDDAAGPLVARRLGEMSVTACALDGDPLVLLDAWRVGEHVVVVDAVVTGRTPGAVSVYDALTAPLTVPALRSSSHALGLAEAVALARTLGRVPGSLTLYGIEGRRFDLFTPPSKAVLRAVERVARRIHEHRAH